MSKNKVDAYKQEKKNRKKTIKKEKLQRIIARILMAVVALALVGWIGWSGYRYFVKDKEGTDAQNVHISVLDEYLEGLEQVEPKP